LELAREPLAVQAEGGEGAVGVDDVKVDGSLIAGWVGGAVEERIGAVGAGAGIGDWGLGIRDWRRNRVCHRKTSDAVLARAGGDFARRAVDVVGWEGKMDEWWLVAGDW